MKIIPLLFFLLPVSGFTGRGAVVSSPAALSPLQSTVITFEDLASMHNRQFSHSAGQPYAPLGLTLGIQMIDAGALLGSDSGGVAVRSATVHIQNFPRTYRSWQIFNFDTGQNGAGLYVFDALATGFTVVARGEGGAVLESANLPASAAAQYAGFLRPEADIHSIVVYGNHLSEASAERPGTFVDDLTFGVIAVPEPSGALLGLTAAAGMLLHRRRRAVAA